MGNGGDGIGFMPGTVRGDALVQIDKDAHSAAIPRSWPALGGTGRGQPGTPEPATGSRRLCRSLDDTIGGIGARSGVDAGRSR
jgi:hypothetical protein